MKHKILTSLKLALFSTALFTANAYSQDTHHDHHSESGFELGVSVSNVFMEKGEANGTSLHFHLMKGLSEHFSLGLGIEKVFADEEHYGLGIILAVHPVDNLTLSIAPGLEWENHEGEWESINSTHLEATYMLDADGFHYGPTIGYAKSDHGEHYKAGIHFGIPF